MKTGHIQQIEMVADIICTDVCRSDSSLIQRGHDVRFFRDEYETKCEADREFSLLIETYDYLHRFEHFWVQPK